MAPATNPARVEARHSAGQAPTESAPHSVTPRGNRKPWQAAWESLPIIQDFRALQAEWDAEAAIAPMPIARPCAAGFIGGGLLLALIGMIGAAFIHTAF